MIADASLVRDITALLRESVGVLASRRIATPG